MSGFGPAPLGTCEPRSLLLRVWPWTSYACTSGSRMKITYHKTKDCIGAVCTVIGALAYTVLHFEENKKTPSPVPFFIFFATKASA